MQKGAVQLSSAAPGTAAVPIHTLTSMAKKEGMMQQYAEHVTLAYQRDVQELELSQRRQRIDEARAQQRIFSNNSFF